MYNLNLTHISLNLGCRKYITSGKQSRDDLDGTFHGSWTSST